MTYRSIVAALGSSETYFRMPDEYGADESALVGRWSLASMITSLIFNILTTGLIAGRIWWHKRTLKRAFGDRAWNFAAV